MRRFASVFAAKREKQDSQVKRAASLAINPPPLVRDHPQSSASSSSGSASLQTPEDDQLRIPSALRPKKSWKSWLKVRTVRHPTNQWDPKHIPHWPPQPSIPHDFDEQDDFVSDESDMLLNTPSSLPISPAQARQNFHQLVENSLVPSPSCPPFIQYPDAPFFFPRSSSPAKNLPHEASMLSTMLKTRLLRRIQDSSRSFSRTEQQYIAPLGARRISPVTPSSSSVPFDDERAPWDKTSIFTSSPGLHRWRSRPCFEDRYNVFMPTQEEGVLCQRVTGTTLAVAALEYSEAVDAMAGYDDDVAPLPSIVTSFPPEVSLPDSRSSPQSSPSSAQPPSPRNAPYIAVPSPLRNEHSPVATSPDVSVPTTQDPVIVPTGAEPPVRRGVRFAEDQKEDVIPLGYVLRMKRKREEKARFLQAEHERRALEEQRARLEEQRRLQEAERMEWEKERMAWERERKTMEEKKQRMYAEEVANTRLRREAARVGGIPSSNNGAINRLIGPGGGPFPSSVSSTAIRESDRNRVQQAYSRDSSQRGTVYDPSLHHGSAPMPIPRRSASERNLPTISLTAHSPQSSSPGSSRTPSVGDGHSTPSLIASGSGSGTRPPSMYSAHELSSSEDVQQQRMAAVSMTNRSKRNSLAASNSSLRLHTERASSYPGWDGSNQSLSYIPAVPMMPTMIPAYVMMDMPLLPPTAPFMLHQYPRQQQGQGTSTPPSSLRDRQSSSSKERVHLPQQGQQGRHLSPPSHSPHRPEYKHALSSPAAPGSASGPGSGTHKRQGSGDPRRASMPPPQPRTMQHGQPRSPRLNSQHSRGRLVVPRSHTGHPDSQSAPPSPQNLQLPSPWTGLPTQNGRPPVVMPVPQSQSQSSLHSGRRSMVA